MILIADYRDRANLLNLANLKWIYIGSSKGSEYVKNILNENNRIFIGRAVDNVIDSIRENFIDYIGKVSQQQSNKVLWYSSRMASKSIQTSMFYQYIYLKVLEKFLESETEDTLIVMDDKELYYNISKVFAGKIKIFKKKAALLRRPYRNLSGYFKIVRYCIFLFLARFFKNKTVGTFDVFLHSWIDERVFRKPPQYNDSYFGDLENVLKKEGHKVGRLTPIRVSFKNIIQLNRYFDNIVYPLAYMPLRDFLKIIFTKITVTLDSQKLVLIKDLKILNILLENEIYKENSTKIFLEYLSFFYSYKMMSSKIKTQSVFIYPFENQPWERMLNAAFVNFKRIAYQHSTIPYNWLDYRISQYEDGVFLPKTILTTGKKWSSFLEKYYSNSTIEEAGAIRFSYLFNKERKEAIDNQVRNIVVALDLVSDISIPLQRQLLAFLKKENLSEYTIKIKPHPYLPEYAILRSLFGVYKNCKFVKNDMKELLENCSLLITSNSSVVFESVFLGIKTLYFVPEEPSLRLEHYLRDSLFIVYSEDFSEKLQEALISSQYPRVNIKEYFSLPDYGIFLKHVRTRMNNGCRISSKF